MKSVIRSGNRSIGRSWRLFVGVAAMSVVAFPTSVRAGYKDEIGFVRLQQRLGNAAPTGAGIGVTQVEADQTTNAHLPDAAHPQFDGKTINPQTAGTPSSHATTVGTFFYGNTSSVAPGIGTIDAYSVDAWLGAGLLRTDTKFAPLVEVRRVQNHSWIGSSEESGLEILRRLDYLIDRDAVVVVVGVNNGSQTAFPDLLGNAYNILAVGLTNGNSTAGPTSLDEPGRGKPDLVVPLTLTSYATPVVGACAALLLDIAHADEAFVAARRPETIRALLLAGASKTPFDLDAATATEFDDWTRTASRPLDLRYGAGQVDIDHSHQILTAGPQPAGDVTPTGWDHAPIAADTTRHYRFAIPAGTVADTLSIVVTWNRRFDVMAPGPNFGAAITASDAPILADIDLSLREDDNGEPGPLLDASLSPIDNVEHIFLRAVPAGAYAFEIASDADTDYAIAWQAHIHRIGDFDHDGDVDLADYLVITNCFAGAGTPPASGCQPTDLDADNDIDLADLLLFQAAFTGAQ